MQISSDTFHGMYVVAKREFVSNLKSIRMILLMIIFTLFVLFTVYIGSFLFSTIGGIDGGNNIEKGPVAITFFLVQFIWFIGPIIGIALAFDVIVKEKIQNSLGLLLCRPVSKRSIAYGKFLGLASALALPVVIVNCLAIGVITVLSGKSIAPLQIIGFLAVTFVFLAIYLALAQLISSLVKTTTTAILAGIGLWFFFWLFLPIIGIMSGSGTAVDLINPGTAYTTCMSDILGSSSGQLLLPAWGYYVIMVVWLGAALMLAVEVFNWKEE
jgi:ABC-2 type transport system permease protein